MSVKQLDFSKHNLMLDPALGGSKRMFGMHFNEGCRHLVKQAFEKITETPTRTGARLGWLRICMSIYVPVNMSGRLCGVGIGMVIRMNASHILEDSPHRILYMTESMMFASVQEIRLSNAKDGVTAGIGQSTKLRKTNVNDVN